jgi:uncharacterized membrane protein YphA (DoxX/SURF4 family)
MVQEDDMYSTRDLNTPWWTLRLALGLTAFLAGGDKFFNFLTDWTVYLSPMVSRLVDAALFMRVVGVIEMVAGLLLLFGITRLGGYIVSAWLVGIALNLLTTGQYFDVAVRDLVMASAAFSLAKLSEARAPEPALIGQPRTAHAPAR